MLLLTVSSDTKAQDFSDQFDLYELGFAAGFINYACILRNEGNINQQQFDKVLSQSVSVYQDAFDRVPDKILKGSWKDLRRQCEYQKIDIGDIWQHRL